MEQKDDCNNTRLLSIGDLVIGQEVYVEYTDMVKLQIVEGIDENQVYWTRGCGVIGYDLIDRYGKEWRAWSSIPSDEERKSIKWDVN